MPYVLCPTFERVHVVVIDGVFLLAVAASSKHVHRVPNHYRGVGESGRRGSAADVQLLPATELQHLLRAGHLDSHSKKGVSTPAIDLQPKKLRACGSELSFALLHLWWALNRTELCLAQWLAGLPDNRESLSAGSETSYVGYVSKQTTCVYMLCVCLYTSISFSEKCRPVSMVL